MHAGDAPTHYGVSTSSGAGGLQAGGDGVTFPSGASPGGEGVLDSGKGVKSGGTVGLGPGGGPSGTIP